MLNKSNESKITRTTIYLPSYIHAKAKEVDLNFSQEFTRYLETVLFGSDTLDIQHQYESMLEREKSLQIELTSVRSRLVELKKLLDTHDARLSTEQKLYEKFVRHVDNRISNCTKGNLAIDFDKLYHFWKSDFFPVNGFSKDMVQLVFNMVDSGCFDFNVFEKLRRGESIGKT